MNGERWKCRAVDTEENQKQVSLSAHSPWKSPKARFPHSHRTTAYRYQKTRKETWRRIASLPPSRLMLRENQIRFSGSFLDENMLLVAFQLNSPRRWQPLQRVVQISKVAVSISKVGADPISTALMVGVVSVGDGEFLEHPKLRFNQV